MTFPLNQGHFRHIRRVLRCCRTCFRRCPRDPTLQVFQRFSELIEGKSAVLISHRFSTVRMADRILFLENGQLLELGSHDELLAQEGKYAELFSLQAEGYK